MLSYKYTLPALCWQPSVVRQCTATSLVRQVAAQVTNYARCLTRQICNNCRRFASPVDPPQNKFHQDLAVCHLYPTQKVYKGGHETPRGCILLREHGGNMVSYFVGVYFLWTCSKFLWVWPAAPNSFCILSQTWLFSCYFWLFVIQMLEFPWGVACGAKKLFYFT